MFAFGEQSRREFPSTSTSSSSCLDHLGHLHQALLHHDEYKANYDMLMSLPVVQRLQNENTELKRKREEEIIQDLQNQLKHAKQVNVNVESSPTQTIESLPKNTSPNISYEIIPSRYERHEEQFDETTKENTRSIKIPKQFLFID